MAEEKKTDWLNPFETLNLPMEDWADGVKDWAFENREAVRPLREPLDWLINSIDAGLKAAPQVVVLALFGVFAWQAAGRKVALITVAAMAAMGLMGARAWDLGMTTLAIVVSSVIVSGIIGLPLGILAGKSDGFQTALRPVLDTMQTIPAFVYLVPVVLLLGIGNVPGVIVTVVFALPPLIRLTALGIRQVNPTVVEAARAYGANPRQVLWKVELPLAMPTIMAGVNQTIMLSLSMVVIASLIAVKGFRQRGAAGDWSAGCGEGDCGGDRDCAAGGGFGPGDAGDGEFPPGSRSAALVGAGADWINFSPVRAKKVI